MIETLIGPVPGTWTVSTLGKACADSGGDIQTGPFGSQLHASDYVSDGIPSIMPQNIGDNRIVEHGIARISEADALRLKRYRVQNRDIVYSRRGDVERRALIRSHESGWLCGTGCLRIRFGDDSVVPEYAAYYLGHPAVRAWIVRHAHGATMPNLNTSILSALPFVKPPARVQREIASALGTLDRKIEINRNMVATLEATTRGLFKSWFVEFDPVYQKAASRKLAFDVEIAAMFPDRFESSECGEIPLGWRLHGLDEIANFVNGLALQKFPPVDGRSLPVVKIAQLRSGSTASADSASSDLDPDYIVDDGDVLFSWSGSLECVLWAGGRAALNQHLFKVTSSLFPKWFYYLWIHQHLDTFRHIAAGKATTMGHIQRHHLSAAKTTVPSLDLLERANQVFSPMIQRIVSARLESRTLAEARDALLPKLVSGEICIEHGIDLTEAIAESQAGTVASPSLRRNAKRRGAKK